MSGKFNLRHLADFAYFGRIETNVTFSKLNMFDNFWGYDI